MKKLSILMLCAVALAPAFVCADALVTMKVMRNNELICAPEMMLADGKDGRLVIASSQENDADNMLELTATLNGETVQFNLKVRHSSDVATDEIALEGAITVGQAEETFTCPVSGATIAVVAQEVQEAAQE